MLLVGAAVPFLPSLSPSLFLRPRGSNTYTFSTLLFVHGGEREERREEGHFLPSSHVRKFPDINQRIWPFLLLLRPFHIVRPQNNEVTFS